MDNAYRSLAALYIQENQLEKAEAIVLEGLSANPDRATLVMYLATVYERQSNFGKAIKTYEALLDKNPDLLVAKNNLASLLTDHGGDQASLDKARAIAVKLKDSQIPQFRDTYAWSSVVAGTNLEEAVQILASVVKDNDQVDVYNYHLGEAYRKKGDSENAALYLNKAIKLAQSGSDIHDKASQSLEKVNQ